MLAFIVLGRKGIGLGKRSRSPSAAERLAKMAKMAEETDHRDFRERARDDYNNRRAEGRLSVYPNRFTPPCFNFFFVCGNLVFFLFFFSSSPTHLCNSGRTNRKIGKFFFFTVL
jgi:hypothetical protein